MNFYPHHIGDFNNATRHLTRVERSVYREAIELYYDTESVLTRDLVKLEKRLLCRDNEEKQALKDILDEFFELQPDGYFHERCDCEITKYRTNISAKAKAGIASAEARKKKATERQQKSTGVKQTVNEIQLTKNQEPITNNQEPIKKNVRKPQSFKEFFNLYPPNKKGGTDQTAWNKAKQLKLSDEDFKLMTDDIDQRKQKMPKWYETYAPGITKYLSESFWLTPVIEEKEDGTSQSTGRKLSHADNVREQAKRAIAEIDARNSEAGNGVVHPDSDVVSEQGARLPNT